MTLRKILAGAALAGSVTLGFAGVAAAQTSPVSTPAATTGAPARHIDCTKVEATLAKLYQRDEAVNDRLTKLEARVAQLRQNGHTKRADMLQQRIDAVKDRLSKVESRLATVEAKVDQKCNVSPGTGTGNSDSTSSTSTTLGS